MTPHLVCCYCTKKRLQLLSTRCLETHLLFSMSSLVLGISIRGMIRSIQSWQARVDRLEMDSNLRGVISSSTHQQSFSHSIMIDSGPNNNRDSFCRERNTATPTRKNRVAMEYVGSRTKKYTVKSLSSEKRGGAHIQRHVGFPLSHRRGDTLENSIFVQLQITSNERVVAIVGTVSDCLCRCTINVICFFSCESRRK